MKAFIFTGATLALSLAGRISYAGYRFPINYTGMVCIEHSTYKNDEVFHLVSKDSQDYLQIHCEMAPGAGGAISTFKSIAIKNLQHGCPYGHQFEYELVADCYIP